MVQQDGEKGLSGWAYADARQCAAILQTPGEVLPGGSLRDVSEQMACRRYW